MRALNMSRYIIIYRLKAVDGKPAGAYHHSQDNYSGVQAMQLTESLESQGYEVHIKPVDSPKSIHVAPRAAVAAAASRG